MGRNRYNIWNCRQRKYKMHTDTNALWFNQKKKKIDIHLNSWDEEWSLFVLFIFGLISPSFHLLWLLICVTFKECWSQHLFNLQRLGFFFIIIILLIRNVSCFFFCFFLYTVISYCCLSGFLWACSSQIQIFNSHLFCCQIHESMLYSAQLLTYGSLGLRYMKKARKCKSRNIVIITEIMILVWM